jgi:hypothetical protein
MIIFVAPAAATPRKRCQGSSDVSPDVVIGWLSTCELRIFDPSYVNSLREGNIARTIVHDYEQRSILKFPPRYHLLRFKLISSAIIKALGRSL